MGLEVEDKVNVSCPGGTKRKGETIGCQQSDAVPTSGVLNQSSIAQQLGCCLQYFKDK
jgi:hypothetical protein